MSAAASVGPPDPLADPLGNPLDGGPSYARDGLFDVAAGPAIEPGFDLDDERLARAAWSRIAEPGDIPAREQVQAHGPGPALRSVLAGRGAKRWRTRLGDLDPVRDLAMVTRFGGRLVIPGDDEWPPVMDELGNEAPFGLWVRGPIMLRQAAERAVAVVGARAATAYGERVAQELGTGCAELGISVVSGAAYGIDGSAHRGALAAGGTTIAVLACGIDRVYPSGHDQLIARIGQVGAVVSEVPPGSSPTRWRFVERNRLIARLSGLVVVVEAAHRSGAASTAARAVKAGVPVAAVPGSVYSPMSYGSHRLLHGGAACVTSAADIAELIGPMGTGLGPLPPMPRAIHDGLPTADLRVFDALPARSSAAVASLVKVAGLEQSVVAAALGRLELAGLAERAGTGWQRARPS